MHSHHCVVPRTIVCHIYIVLEANNIIIYNQICTNFITQIVMTIYYLNKGQDNYHFSFDLPYKVCI